MATEQKLERVEQQLGSLKDDLSVCKAAKKISEACEELHEYSTKEEEPFGKDLVEPNLWHKNPGGGGCVIL